MKRKIKLGLLGNGIGRTQSKKLHELIGEIYDLDVSYELMDLSGRDDVKIEDELQRCKEEGYDGVNVTHPYKRDAFLHVDVMKGFPRGLTSVNTVLLQGENLLADNTDYIGFYESYQKYFSEQNPGKVLMLGAGGVGLAIAYGLYRLKATELIIHDMNEALASSLVEELQSYGFNARLLKDSLIEEMQKVDGLINATPLGMYQYPRNPFPLEGFANQRWSFDAVYTPVHTEFLKECEVYNIKTISGFHLFLNQGVEAFKRFSGLDVDVQKIEKIFLERYPQAD